MESWKMRWEFSTRRRDDKCIKTLVWKSEGNRPPGRLATDGKII
jgi:hypothetical protein